MALEKKNHKALLDGRNVFFSFCGEENAPAVYTTVFGGEAEEILSECEKISVRPFNLAAVIARGDSDWDADLSPWPCEKIFSKNDGFLGKAAGYAEWICEKLVPAAEKIFGKPAFRVAAGYSMAGLFSLYAPTVADIFSRIVSASGSVWYPGFVSYIKENSFKSEITRIYLSLGDREKFTKNKYLKDVESCTEQLYEIFKSRGIETFFEMNPGNHFQDSGKRLSKGIKHALS